MTSVPITTMTRRPLLELLVVNLLRLLASPRPWAAAVFGVLSFLIGTFWFVMLVTFISMGVGLAVTFLGIPILLVTAWLWTWGARAERLRVNTFLAHAHPILVSRAAGRAMAPAHPRIRHRPGDLA